MTTQAGATTIRREIVVDAPLERAFAVFVKQFDRIKPREHNMLGVPIVETVFEPRVGGHIYDRGEDGSECRWSPVLAYDPPNATLGGEDLIRVAVGRDIHQIIPIAGTYQGVPDDFLGMQVAVTVAPVTVVPEGQEQYSR